MIIRELQRTNLDVNLAVNNLLSRDEEDGDDADDAQDNYVPEVIIYQALACQHYKLKTLYVCHWDYDYSKTNFLP